jgi:hypothetical protein
MRQYSCVTSTDSGTGYSKLSRATGHSPSLASSSSLSASGPVGASLSFASTTIGISLSTISLAGASVSIVIIGDGLIGARLDVIAVISNNLSRFSVGIGICLVDICSILYATAIGLLVITVGSSPIDTAAANVVSVSATAVTTIPNTIATRSTGPISSAIVSASLVGCNAGSSSASSAVAGTSIPAIGVAIATDLSVVGLVAFAISFCALDFSLTAIIGFRVALVGLTNATGTSKSPIAGVIVISVIGSTVNSNIGTAAANVASRIEGLGHTGIFARLSLANVVPGIVRAAACFISVAVCLRSCMVVAVAAAA